MPSPAISARAERAPAELEARIAAQQQAIAAAEAALWAGGGNLHLLPAYQAAWRELERLIAARGADRRAGFVLIIPVADNPCQLRTCLASLLHLCQAYGYGGQDAAGRWRKLSVLLADDSAGAEAQRTHQQIAETFRGHGLRIHYFGPQQQLALLERLRGIDLTGIVGSHPRAAFSHKGQAMTRNLAYLRVAEMQADEARALGGPLLCYTLDADQTFEVRLATALGDVDVAAISFLHRLEHLFRDPAVQVLTGKVVGDPPVSPAVMAGNFLLDVLALLDQMAQSAPDLPYPGHLPNPRGAGEAAYHDLADLFGFHPGQVAYRYRCNLPGMVSNAACLADFARRLHGFFHGQHLTRVTYFRAQAATPAPARTVYTGNYVFRAHLLTGFIPFAPLRLRMSGPSMGRLLRAELGAGFVSANLPMRHARTLAHTGQSEFRPGVVEGGAGVELADEFERQFHGDVMLFALERLTALGYPATLPPAAVVAAQLAATAAELGARYAAERVRIQTRLAQLEARLQQPACWWQQDGEVMTHLRTFAADLRRNFGPHAAGYRRIDDPRRTAAWQQRQLAAILELPAQRRVWADALARLREGAPG